MFSPHCPACGAAPTSHWTQWLDATLAEWMEAWMPSLWRAWGNARAVRQFTQQLWMGVVWLLELTGVSRREPNLATHPNLRTRALWESAERLGVRMAEVRTGGRPCNIFIVSFNDRTIVFEGLPRPLDRHWAVVWMDDKEAMRKRLANAGLPVARGGAVKTRDAARRMFATLTPPVIVKPRTGSRSRHTTIGITTPDALQQAYRSAKQLCRWVMIEEEIPGAVHRALVVDGVFRACCKRDYPQVIGDGANSIALLAEEENKNPLRAGPIFYTLPTRDSVEAAEILKRQGWKWDAIPPRGAVARLSEKVNRGGGGAITEVTPLVHPNNRQLFESIAQVVDDPLIGIDIIFEDVGRSWKGQRCAVIELNSLPFLDLHTYPLRGTPVLVADYVWRMVFPLLSGAVGSIQSASSGTK